MRNELSSFNICTNTLLLQTLEGNEGGGASGLSYIKLYTFFAVNVC